MILVSWEVSAGRSMPTGPRTTGSEPSGILTLRSNRGLRLRFRECLRPIARWLPSETSGSWICTLWLLLTIASRNPTVRTGSGEMQQHSLRMAPGTEGNEQNGNGDLRNRAKKLPSVSAYRPVRHRMFEYPRDVA